MAPNLDQWLNDPALRVAHERGSDAAPDRLWEAARAVRIKDTALLGRLVRWRIPGIPPETTFDQLFRSAPFLELESGDHELVSGIVGRIWTLRRDYPSLEHPDEFKAWSKRGTARVLFANWVESTSSGRALLYSEARVQVFGAQGRIGLGAVRPLVRAFDHVIATDGIGAAVRLAEREWTCS